MWQTRFGRCIHTSPSGYKVYQNYFYRWLTFGNTILQSVINRRHPEKSVLYYIPALTLPIDNTSQSVCLLGLGGAAIPLMLAHQMPEIALDTIDNNIEIITIARHYFINDSIHNLNIIHQNAATFVQESTTIYSHLIVDLYGAHYFPQECCNEMFFNSCKKIIADNGFITINLANPQEQWPIFQLLSKQFRNTLIIPIKKCANMVIIASNHEGKESFLNRFHEHSQIKRIMWVESWGYVADFE